MLTASADGVIRLWDFMGGKRGHRFDCKPFKGKVLAATMSTDGLVAAALSDDAKLHIWKINYAEHKTIPIMKFQFPSHGMHLCEFLPASKPNEDENDERALGTQYKVPIFSAGGSGPLFIVLRLPLLDWNMTKKGSDNELRLICWRYRTPIHF